MKFRRSYYSIGLAVVWAVLPVLAFSLKGPSAEPVLWVFGGFAIAWVFGTIARCVYAPPRRWTEREPS